METKRLTLAVAIAVGLALAGCGGGGGSSSSSTDDTTTDTTTVATSTTQSGAASTQSATIAANSSQTISNLSGVALSSMAGAPAYRSPVANASADARFSKMHAAELSFAQATTLKAAAVFDAARAASAGATQTISSTTESCTDGGTVAYSGTYDDVSGAYDISFSFSDCRESTPDGDGTAMNGPMGFSSTDGTNFTMTMGDGDSSLESTDLTVQLYSGNYTNFYGSMLADMSMDMSYTVDDNGTAADASDDSYTFSYAVNGSEQYNDFTNTYTIAYSSFNLDAVMAADGSSGQETVAGGFSEEWTEDGTNQGVAITFTSFVTDWTASSTAFDYAVNGTVGLDFTPDDLCYEGTNTIATTTDIHVLYDNGYPTAGVVQITDASSNTSTITYNSDGTVTVSDGSNTDTYDSAAEMELSCPLQDFDDTTAETNTSGTGTATGDDMLITLTWTGGSTSDMDLHTYYYDTTSPSSTTTVTSYINYTGYSYCIAPTDSTVYWDGMDLNGDGTCEAGLDYDDTEGYGPEHITATSLPDGYYVVVVNSFSLDDDPNATVSVTIKIGGTLFEFPTHTFTTADGYGTDPNSWYRVADIRVSGGTAEVIAPNTNLEPMWSSVAYAPRAK